LIRVVCSGFLDFFMMKKAAIAMPTIAITPPAVIPTIIGTGDLSPLVVSSPSEEPVVLTPVVAVVTVPVVPVVTVPVVPVEVTRVVVVKCHKS
jgi:hypothetical protein